MAGEIMIDRRSCCIAAVVAIGATFMAHAHPDDPKLKDRQPAYEGPGWRAGVNLDAPGLDFPAQGVELMAWLPIGEFGSFNNANDCWGYVSPAGREYAILGLSGGTAVVEVTEPGNPLIVDVIDGPSSLWRDIKVYQHYAYSVTEGSGAGIQVIDLGDVDDGEVTLAATINAGGTTRTHNVALDAESGYLYRTGGSSNGLRIYSLDDPTDPQLVGEWSTRYVHDAQVVTYTEGPYAGKQIAFCCSGYNGGWVETGLDILDVTDKGNIVEMGRLLYPNAAYSHQAWLSEDRQYLYLNDELDENGTLPTTTFVIDVSDLDDPAYVDTFTNGNTAIGHNLYVRGDLIFEANYRSGLRVFDASEDPVQPTEIAYFDTYPNSDGASFNGLWSNYPFFPSGTVIGSDIEKGLFVWSVDALVTGPPADLNGDGSVDVEDLLQLLAAWGTCDPACDEDLNDDGAVNVTDLLELLADWG
jgi:choice-of-anchor B domain-containing protein